MPIADLIHEAEGFSKLQLIYKVSKTTVEKPSEKREVEFREHFVSTKG
jgi:hypothetical protein